MTRETEQLKNIMLNMARGQDIGHRLEFDPRKKSVKPVSTSPWSSNSPP